MFKTSSTIDTYCATYEPIRNYLECPVPVINDINRNNNRYLYKCLDDTE